jgi:hypothetical protein
MNGSEQSQTKQGMGTLGSFEPSKIRSNSSGATALQIAQCVKEKEKKIHKQLLIKSSKM